MIFFPVQFPSPAGLDLRKAGIEVSFYLKGKIYIAPLSVFRYSVFRGWGHVAPHCEVTA